MKKTLLVFFLGLFFGVMQVMAQQRTVTGKVTSAEDGIPIPGATVKIKGTSVATQANTNGIYTISANTGDILQFAYLGMLTKEQTVGASTTINVVLNSDTKTLSEVAITAFGIKQEVRSLGFSTQNVKPSEIVESHQPNIVNALQGKIAGVQVTNSSGAPGASSSIMIRGGTSLSGNNQPLFVVDGIPIDNTTPVTQGGLTAGTSPGSNRGVDINPEDIEAVTVLKGPAAAALYGIRAASGAIVITTRRGSGGAGKISYSNSFSVDKVNQLPTLQSTFKQGLDGPFDATAYTSWGPAFTSGETIYNNLEDFFQNAFAQNHDLSVSGSTDKSSFFASASLLNQDGIAKNSNFDRKSFRINAEHSLSDKLKVGLNANYVKTGRDYFSQGSANGIMAAVYWPRNDDMRNYIKPDGTQRVFTANGEGGIDNPYWTINKKPNFNDVNRIIGVANISYDPLKWLNLSYRLGTDFYAENFQSVMTPTSQTGLTGYLGETATNNQVTTSTFIATAKKSIKDFNLSLSLGQNLEATYRSSTTATAIKFIEPDFVSLNNSVLTDRTVSKAISRRRIIGAFGDLSLDWKNIAYLNFRARNDWSSTLPKANNSFFYPSLSGAVVLTDLFKEMGKSIENNVLNYVKLRAAWAQVGKDAPGHRLETTLGTTINAFTINPRGFITNINDFYGNPNLKPEFTNSYELGADLRFWKNRIGLDFTWYKSLTKEQILGTRTPPSAGAFLAYLNGGSIENKGIEAILNLKAIQKSNFSWTADFNFGKSKSTVKDLPGALDRVELSDAWVANSVAQGAAFLGGTLFGINGQTWKRNAQGQLLLSNTGYPQVVTTLSQIGDRNPDWNLGITNTFRYKSLGLSFMWDVRSGGDVFNATENSLVRSGLSTKTLDRGTKVIEGIIESTGLPNTASIPLNRDFYQTYYAAQGSLYVEDGSWVRLRYITLSYNLPSSILKKIKVSNLQFSVTGRNLILITDYSGVDPEVSGSGAGVEGAGSFGFDNLGVPTTKGFDFGLKLSF